MNKLVDEIIMQTIEIIDECYTFDHIFISDFPILPVIDMGYIITVDLPKYNTRKENVLNEVKKFQVCRKVKLLKNKGLKCKKKNVTKTYEDLTDAYHTILKDAKKFDYKNIIIFEDDCFFDKKLSYPSIHREINNFIEKGDYFLYSLGGYPLGDNKLLSLSPHLSPKQMTQSHCVIYSKKFIDDLLADTSDYNHWDQQYRKYQMYTYETPLAYQLMEDTDNYKTWGSNVKEVNISDENFLMSHKTHQGFSMLFVIHSLRKTTLVICVFFSFLFLIKFFVESKNLNLMGLKKN